MSRRDGKPARTNRHTTPASTPPPAKTDPPRRTCITTWHELVDGPRGDQLAAPARTHERRLNLGQVIQHRPSRIEVPQGDGRRRERRITRRGQGVHGVNHGVLHRRRRTGALTAFARENMRRTRAHLPLLVHVGQ